MPIHGTISWTNISSTPNISGVNANFVNRPCAWDSTRNRLWMLRGDNTNASPPSPPWDMWYITATGLTWIQVTPSAFPSSITANGRTLYSFVYDPVLDRLIMWGGEENVSGTLNYHNDTWVYTVSSNTWTALTTTGGPPAARGGMSMAYD